MLWLHGTSVFFVIQRSKAPSTLQHCVSLVISVPLDSHVQGDNGTSGLVHPTIMSWHPFVGVNL